MDSAERALIMQRFQLAMHLYELSEAMFRQRLRRQYPEASDAEIEVKVHAWQRHRPGAEHGDGDGRPVPWPRPRR